MERVACILVNYNMPERTNLLVSYLKENSAADVVVVDNGSDMVSPSPFTTVRLKENVQTTHGWLMGLAYADALAFTSERPFFAYWFLTTSMLFSDDNVGDPAQKLAQVLVKDPLAVSVSPAWKGELKAWTHRMVAWNGTDEIEEKVFTDTACMHRAAWFDGAGRFDKRLTYSWGTDIDMALKVQQAGRRMYVHHGVRMDIAEDVGYQMGRMGMSGQDRKRLAYDQMDRVLTEKWPIDWPKVRQSEQIDHRLYH